MSPSHQFLQVGIFLTRFGAFVDGNKAGFKSEVSGFRVQGFRDQS